MIRKYLIYFLPMLALLLIYAYGIYQDHKIIYNAPLPASLFSECLDKQIKTIEASIGTTDEIILFDGFVSADDLKAVLEGEIAIPRLWIFFCQLLGQENSQLKALWPSHTKPYEIINYDGYSLKYTKLADKVAKQSIRYLANQWGFEFSNTPYIILAYRLERISSIIPSSLTSTVVQSRIDNICESDRAAGYALTPVLLICLSKNESEDAFRLPFIIAHEIFHFVQTELVASSEAYTESFDPSERYGPYWMKEGCASAFAQNYVITNEINKMIFDYKKLTISPTISYAEYTNYKQGSILHNLGQDHTSNTMALCNHLVEIHGFKSIINFYRNIGGDEHWQDVFYRLFKIKHDDYLLSMGAIDQIPQID